jgi:hypothetical protein
MIFNVNGLLAHGDFKILKNVSGHQYGKVIQNSAVHTNHRLNIDVYKGKKLLSIKMCNNQQEDINKRK